MQSHHSQPTWWWFDVDHEEMFRRKKKKKKKSLQSFFDKRMNGREKEKWILISFYCHQALFVYILLPFVESRKLIQQQQKYLEALSLVMQRKK